MTGLLDIVEDIEEVRLGIVEREGHRCQIRLHIAALLIVGESWKMDCCEVGCWEQVPTLRLLEGKGKEVLERLGPAGSRKGRELE